MSLGSIVTQKRCRPIHRSSSERQQQQPADDAALASDARRTLNSSRY